MPNRLLLDAEVKPLTGLRGVAASFVVIYHYFQPVITGGRLGVFLHHGYLSVDLFFVLSGFVMMLSYERRFEWGFKLRNYLDFLHKRFARVYPLYAVITIVFAIVRYLHVVPDAHPDSAHDIVLNVLLIHGWGLAPGIGAATWSISTELAAYLLFPLFVILVPSWRGAILAIGSITTLLVLSHLSTAQVEEFLSNGLPGRNGPLDIYETDTPYPLLRCLAGFALGIVAFRLGQSKIGSAAKQMHYAGDFAAGTLLVCMCIRSADVVIVSLFVPLIICMEKGNSLTRSALETRFIHWLGLISYSIYLIHLLLNALFRVQLTESFKIFHIAHGYTIGGVLLLIPVIVVSAVSYYMVEQPARDALRLLIGQRVTAMAQEPSAP